MFDIQSLLTLAQADGAVESSLSGLGRMPVYILAGYLVLLLILGLAGWIKSKRGEEDYYLAGRSQGWLVSSVTIMATFFSSFALLGAPGMVYREGVMFALFSLNVPIAGLSVYLIGSRIWKAGRRFGYVTPGDMVADYYGSHGLLKLLVAITCVLYVLPYVVMQIQSGGILSEKLFPGEHTIDLGFQQLTVGSFALGSTVLAAVTMLYIMVGGMRSVAWTDLIQGLLLISGMLVSGMAMFLAFDGPANFGQRICAELPDNSLTIPGNTGGWPWSLLLTVCAFGSIGSMVQPAQWMRFYAASGTRTLKRGAVIFAVVLTSCFILGVMLIGLAGQLLYPLNFTLQESFEIPADQILVEADSVAGFEQSMNAEHRTWTWQTDDGYQFQLQEPTTNAEQRSATVSWNWMGAADRNMPSTAQSEFSELSSHPNFRRAIDRLAAQSADPSQRPSVAAHADVKDYNSILVVVVSQKLPVVFGQLGAIVAALILVAIMAASMSTADSNLHALAAVGTRDVYDQFIQPDASQGRRVWVGRILIAVATVLALIAVISGQDEQVRSQYDIIAMIAQMGLMAIAFSAQLLPVVVDMLFIRKGTAVGAIGGLAGGLLATFVCGPLFKMLASALGSPQVLTDVLNAVGQLTSTVKVHGSVWGLVVNVPIFVVLSLLTRHRNPGRVREFAETFASRG